MLEFFRKHQRVFLTFVAIIIIISFSFFGTYSAMGSFEKKKEIVVGHAVDGSKLTYSDIVNLAHLLGAEKNSSRHLMQLLLKSGAAERLAIATFDSLKGEWQTRLDRAKRARFYAHPAAPFLNARDLWAQLAPEMMEEVQSIQKREEVAADFFASWARLYSMQEKVPGEWVKRVIFYQQNQLRLPPDRHLPTEDFSLFGYRTMQDWFGRDFFELTAQFILNGAIVAEEQGYQVKEKEAEAEIANRFDPQILRSLGLKKKDAVRLWQKALAFESYFQGVGQAVLLDPLPYQQFAEFAGESLEVDLYRLPRELQMRTLDDLVAFEAYVHFTCQPDPLLPQALLSMEEIEKRAPELLFTAVELRVAELDLTKLAARLSMREVWNWQSTSENWQKLRGHFTGIAQAATAEERFRHLEQLDAVKRAALDDWSRRQIVLERPESIEEAFAGLSIQDKECALFEDVVEGFQIQNPKAFREFLTSGGGDYREEGQNWIWRITDVRMKETQSLLSFAQAKEKGRLESDRFLAEQYRKMRSKTPSLFKDGEGQWKPLQNVKELVLHHLFPGQITDRFRSFMQNALVSLSTGQSLTTEGLWKIEKTQQTISRTTNEEWMMQETFALEPGQWSPIYVPPNGEIVFFFVTEKRIDAGPILEQIQLGREAVVSDVQRQLTDRLLDVALKKKAIVTPLRTEEEKNYDNL